MSKCVCGNELPKGNKFCCLACFRADSIPVIESNLHVGGDYCGYYLRETKSLISNRFSIGMLDMMDLFELKKHIISIERLERRKKVEALQKNKELINNGS